MVTAAMRSWRGLCPSCGARRMAQTAARLVDCVIPRMPVRQWVLSHSVGGQEQPKSAPVGATDMANSYDRSLSLSRLIAPVSEHARYRPFARRALICSATAFGVHAGPPESATSGHSRAP